MRTKEITQLLSTHVPFIAAEVSNQSKLCKYLGVRTEVDVGDLERLLIRWSKREKEEPETFTTSLVHMNHVYKHLQENLPPKRLQELLQNHPVIFVPDDDPSEPLRSPTDEFVRGKFYNREEVIWGDPTGMCLKYKKLLNDPELDKGQRRLLEYVYPNLEDIFRRGALVAETPNTKEYLDLLEAITQHFTPYSRLLDILAIFTQFGRLLADEQVNDVLEQVPLKYFICARLDTISQKYPLKKQILNGYYQLAGRMILAPYVSEITIFRSSNNLNSRGHAHNTWHIPMLSCWHSH